MYLNNEAHFCELIDLFTKLHVFGLDEDYETLHCYVFAYRTLQFLVPRRKRPKSQRLK